MKVSLNSIKQLTTVDMPVDELVTKINRQLGGVEEVVDLGARYDGATIVKVVTCEKHPNADKLSVCEVDDGSGELVQVVCGAPNVHAGMFAVWLKPGSVVPSTASDKEPFVLGARELRGVMSNGMLASAKELGLGDSHDGILEIDPSEWKPNTVEIKAGASFAAAYGLDDTTIDIENKMFTHRPDLFGQLGVAREIAGIQHLPFKSPDWYATASVDTLPVAADTLPLVVFNEAKERVPRFMTLVIAGVEVKPSPVWLQAELVRLGGKPINNIVDSTNYVMLMTAQPTHAYDYDKLRGATLGTRLAKTGEKAELLNGKTYELTDSDIVIADGEGVVGLGGIMGGGNSEVSADTMNIVLEVANFDMYTVRKSSMRHGLFTDALTRFNKGQSPLQNEVVLRYLLRLIHDVAGGNVASQLLDESAELATEKTLFIHENFINERLGLSLSKSEIEKLLSNVEFAICQQCDESDHDDGSIHYATPFWRTDIELPEDIVEEVGRLYGFEKLPRVMPLRSVAPVQLNPKFEAATRVRQALARAGANEVLTYSFVHENIIKKASQDKSKAYKLSNALSPDLQYYRLSLTPSLLDKVHMNIKAGYDNFGLFELNKVHYKNEMDVDEPDVPDERSHIAFVIAYSDKKAPAGAPYYHALRHLNTITNSRAFSLVPMTDFDTSEDGWNAQVMAPYEPARSAVIVKDNQTRGVIGEYKQSVAKGFKLPAFAAGFEIYSDVVSEMNDTYQPLSRFPSVSQDVSIRVADDVSYMAVAALVNEVTATVLHPHTIVWSPVSIYEPTEGEHKTTTFRLRMTSYEATLTDDDVRPIVQAIEARVKQDLNGHIV